MISQEAERLWREIAALTNRVEVLERRASDYLDKTDLSRLRDSIDSLEKAVLSAVEFQRDSTVVPTPKPSLSPSAKLRGELLRWALVALAVAAAGAVGALVQTFL